mgnify:CR=1 FL=1
MRNIFLVLVGGGLLWLSGVVPVLGGPQDTFGDTWNWSLPPKQFSLLAQTAPAGRLPFVR